MRIDQCYVSILCYRVRELLEGAFGKDDMMCFAVMRLRNALLSRSLFMID